MAYGVHCEADRAAGNPIPTWGVMEACRAMSDERTQLQIRDIRTLPFFWIQRALFDTIHPSWRGLVAYNALSYYAARDAATCRNIGIKQLAELVSVSEDTMKRGLDELQKKKAVKVVAKFRTLPKSRQTATESPAASGSTAKHKHRRRQQLPNEYILIDLGTPKEQPI